MKRTLALILAAMMVLAIMAGCGAKTGTEATPGTATQAPTEAQPTADVEPTTDVPSEGGVFYNYAAGKAAMDADGNSTGFYDYEQPITNSDEVLEYWTRSWVPQYIPEEGFSSMVYPQEIQKRTGINIEWTLVPADTCAENFSVLLAADDLPDMISLGSSYYPGTPLQAVEDGYYVNLYDYRDYCPNYNWLPFKYGDKDSYEAVYYTPEVIAYFASVIEHSTIVQNYCARNDFLKKLDLNYDDIDTYDEVHDMLVMMQTQLGLEHPMSIFATVEIWPAQLGGGYDTAMYMNNYGLPYCRLIDGKPAFTLLGEDDRKAMQMLTDWYSQGLVDPNWQGVTSTLAMNDSITNDKLGYVVFTPGEIKDFEDNTQNPDVEWIGLKRPMLYEGQVFKYGAGTAHIGGGGATISTKCPNIELAVTWFDYFYSDDGATLAYWGVEGVTWNYNDDGERMLTDFAVNNPDGLGVTWLMTLYANNGLADPVYYKEKQGRNYAYEGGERLMAIQDYWQLDEYDGSYDWPSSIKYTTEESTEIYTYSGDVQTYLGENWLSFVDGSKPMSDWDAYVKGAYDLGLTQITEIYQQAYDRWLNS